MPMVAFACGKRALGRGNVGPALGKLRRNPRRNRRRSVQHRLHRDREIRRHLAHQGRDACSYWARNETHIDGRRLRRIQMCPRLDHRNVVADPGVIRALCHIQRLLVGIHGLLQELLQLILSADLEEVLRQATAATSFTSSRSAALTWAAYSCERTWLRIRPTGRESMTPPRESTRGWTSGRCWRGRVAQIPGAPRSAPPHSEVTVGQYCARASRPTPAPA